MEEDPIARIAKKVDQMHQILTGNGKLGLVAKVQIMWNAHVWVVGLVGVALGAVICRMVS